MAGNYTQTLVAAKTEPKTTPIDYKVQGPFIREIVASGVVSEPTLAMEISSAQSFFTGETLIQANELLKNLRFGQELKLIVEKDQNPLSMIKSSTIAYEQVDSCHDRMKLNCSVPCISTDPEFQTLTFRFDTEYAYGVRYCDKDSDFWTVEYATKQFAKSKRAYEFVRGIDTWNKVVKGLIAAPARTADAFLAATKATHYWANLGKVGEKRALISQAYFYMVNTFGITPTVFMTAEAANEIILSVQNAYNLNANYQIINTFKAWDLPGFQVADSVKTILGITGNVVIMKRSPWLAVAGGAGAVSSTFPLLSADGKKQYVAILDPRVGYSFEKKAYTLNLEPTSCDNLVRGTIDTIYTGSGITFPQYGSILEFSGLVA